MAVTQERVERALRQATAAGIAVEPPSRGET
jgi:hypothetical protein